MSNPASVNFYSVLSKIHLKATGSVDKSVEEDLQVPDPQPEQAKAILESTTDENTKGKDGASSSNSDREDS